MRRRIRGFRQDAAKTGSPVVAVTCGSVLVHASVVVDR
jgi:hypothetical protein